MRLWTPACSKQLIRNIICKWADLVCAHACERGAAACVAVFCLVYPEFIAGRSPPLLDRLHPHISRRDGRPHGRQHGRGEGRSSAAEGADNYSYAMGDNRRPHRHHALNPPHCAGAPTTRIVPHFGHGASHPRRRRRALPRHRAAALHRVHKVLRLVGRPAAGGQAAAHQRAGQAVAGWHRAGRCIDAALHRQALYPLPLAWQRQPGQPGPMSAGA